MGFKIKGGRPVIHTKWALENDGITLAAVASDCNEGSVFQTVLPVEDGQALAKVLHIGRLKFSSELVELTRAHKVCRNTESAKGWCRKTALGLSH